MSNASITKISTLTLASLLLMQAADLSAQFQVPLQIRGGGRIIEAEEALDGNEGSEEAPANFPNSFSPVPRELWILLNEANYSLEEGDFQRAIERLAALLDGEAARQFNLPEGQDYFIGPRFSGGTRSSLKAEARRLLGELPERGLDFYELHRGTDARLALERAIESGDLESLMEVTRMYFHTEAGYDAMLLLGYRYLSDGQPLAAAYCFQRLVESPAATQFDPQLTLLWATSLQSGGMTEQAAESLIALERRMPGVSLQIGRNVVRLPREGELTSDWIGSHLGMPGGWGQPAENEWCLFRGNPSRTAHASGSFPLRSARTGTLLAKDPADEEHIKARFREFISQNIPALPAGQPLAVGYQDAEGENKSIILVRSMDQLLGIDFETGKIIWEFPSEPDNESQEASEGLSVVSSRQALLNQRVWDDNVYGQFSSDGDLIFLTHHSENADPSVVNRNIPGRGFGIFVPSPSEEYNELVALSLSCESKLEWIVGGKESPSEPELADAFFLGAPLPMWNQLFAIIEINREIRLVALEAGTGKLLWSQQLAHADNRPIAGDALRRLAGASPSFADGVLVCPTSAGAVVAIDVTTRELLWGYQYATQPVNPRHQALLRAGRLIQPPKPMGQRWLDSTCTLADGKVLLTPVESEPLICLDLITGEELWRHNARHKMLYVAGVFQGNAILVGHDEVRALSLETGDDNWSRRMEIPGDAQVSGRGFISDGFLFLPTTFPELLQISLHDGVIVKQATTDTILGNLICCQDDVISLGVDRVLTFHQERPLRELVDRRLAENANDAEAIKLLAELQLHDGHFQEALALLRKAHGIAPADESIRATLVKTLLEGLRTDYSANASLAAELDSLIVQAGNRSEYLRLMARGADEAGDIEQAFFFYLQVLFLDPTSLVAESDRLTEVDRARSVDSDAWIRARLISLYERASQEEKGIANLAVDDIFENARAREENSPLERFVNLFPWHPRLSQARVELAHRLSDKGRRLAAEQIWLELRRGEGREAGIATAQLARLWTETGQFAEAAALYRQLESQWNLTLCLDDKKGAELAAEARLRPELNLFLDDDFSWNRGAAEVVSDNISLLHNVNQTLFPVKILHEGSSHSQVQVLFDMQLNSLVIRNPNGRTISQISLNQSDSIYPRGYYPTNYAITHGKIRGHLLVVSMGLEIIAVDLLGAPDTGNPRILWRKNLAIPQPNQVMRVQPKVVQNPWTGQQYRAIDQTGQPVGALGPLSPQGICFQRGRELRCVDPISGQDLWTRNDVDPGSDLFGDDEFLFAVAPGSTTARLFRLSDGEEIDSCPVPREEFRWATIGRRILTWDQVNHRMNLRLFDPIEERDIWNYRCAPNSKGYLLENRYVGVMQKEGQFDLITLADGSKVVETTLEPESDFGQIFMLASPEQFFLALNNPLRRPRFNLSVQSAPGGMHSPMIYGRLYAFDRRTGQASWQSPAFIDHYGLPLDQPTDSPALLFMRNVTNVTTAGQRTTVSSALLIDRRDGRILTEVSQPNTRTARYGMVARPESQEVSLLLPSKTVTLTLTNKPRPPEPPAQTGSHSSLQVPRVYVDPENNGRLDLDQLMMPQ